MMKKLTGKTRTLVIVGAAVVMVVVVGFIAALALRTDAAQAREIALAATGGGEIVSQEIDQEGLWSEYSFDILNGNTRYEVDINAFGKVTGLESSQGGYGGYNH